MKRGDSDGGDSASWLTAECKANQQVYDETKSVNDPQINLLTAQHQSTSHVYRLDTDLVVVVVVVVVEYLFAKLKQQQQQQQINNNNNNNNCNNNRFLVLRLRLTFAFLIKVTRKKVTKPTSLAQKSNVLITGTPSIHSASQSQSSWFQPESKQ